MQVFVRATLVGLLLSPAAGAQQALLEMLLGDLPTDPEQLADAIIVDVAEIRGLEFQRDIAVSDQSQDEFETYLAGEMDRSLPPERAAVFGRVVRKLGLHRGPVIEDAVELMTLLATSQAAAYYDPEASTFYVLVADAPMVVLAPLYAHELYQGLQDQYWGLDAYLLDAQSEGLNDDEVLARQAVVEGEATYIMTLWLLREATGQIPSGAVLDMAVQMQSQLDAAALRTLAADSMVPGSLGGEFEASISAMDDIPAFMMETLLGVYLKGMGFVHQVVKQGWDGAERLYTDPPQSTEQILHPEKWLERDAPVLIGLPESDADPLLDGWTLLDSNVIGEFQLRVIFNEFGMSDSAPAVAAGWDGDRFAVYEKDDELLLLLYTTWDSAAEATEFAEAYEALLAVKYEGVTGARAVDRRGRDVLIVEGGASGDTDAYIEWLAGWPRSD